MGGDKKPSAQYFVDGGHGKTVIAEVRLPERTLPRRPADDDGRSRRAGAPGDAWEPIASGMPSVAFSPASIVAAIFAATGQDLGMVGHQQHGAHRARAGGRR